MTNKDYYDNPQTIYQPIVVEGRPLSPKEIEHNQNYNNNKELYDSLYNKTKTIADHTIDTINRVDRLEEVLTNNQIVISSSNNFSLNNKELIDKLLNK
ncbi:hypothetical protein [Paraclostridium dentum]|uniref:hypothetical protein n=1 Tax=Paraclostridium dentum TaxID=2662455 RepID=UPI003F2BA44A